MLIAGAAAKHFTTSLAKEQEVLMNISDMAMETYVGESLVLRIEKMKAMGLDYKMQKLIMQTYIYDAADRLNKWGKDAVNSFAEGDEQRALLMGIKRFSKQEAFNTKDARREIANQMIEANKYCY